MTTQVPHQTQQEKPVTNTTCARCEKQFPSPEGLRIKFAICNACADASAAKLAAEKLELRRDRDAKRWADFCPAKYRTIVDTARQSRLSRQVIGNRPHCLLSGPSGTGKTTAAFLAARSELPLTATAKAISDQMFCRCSSEAAFHSSTEFIQSLMSCDLLLFDDLGKATATARYQTDLLDLIEARTGHERRTIVTTNWKPNEFFKHFDKDIREALRRRMADHFAVIETSTNRNL